MGNTPAQLQEMIDMLKRQRDELALKMHLGKAEAKQEYERLSVKVDELLRQYEPVKDAAADAAKGVFAALILAGEEMKNGFERIRKSL